MIRSAEATLGIIWDPEACLFDAGVGWESMIDMDLGELKANIEHWRDDCLHGEAQGDWQDFLADVSEANRRGRCRGERQRAKSAGWVCDFCGSKWGTASPQLTTCNMGTCEVCLAEDVPVCHVRNYRWLWRANDRDEEKK